MLSMSAWTSLMQKRHVFVSRLCHSWQTHRFRCCSLAAVGAFECPKTNCRNGNSMHSPNRKTTLFNGWSYMPIWKPLTYSGKKSCKTCSFAVFYRNVLNKCTTWFNHCVESLRSLKVRPNIMASHNIIFSCCPYTPHVMIYVRLWIKKARQRNRDDGIMRTVADVM